MKVFDRIKKFITYLLAALSGRERIHYINGAETLPPPMPPEEEARMIAAAEAGNEWARKS